MSDQKQILFERCEKSWTDVSLGSSPIVSESKKNTDRDRHEVEWREDGWRMRTSRLDWEWKHANAVLIVTRRKGAALRWSWQHVSVGQFSCKHSFCESHAQSPSAWREGVQDFIQHLPISIFQTRPPRALTSLVRKNLGDFRSDVTQSRHRRH